MPFAAPKQHKIHSTKQVIETKTKSRDKDKEDVYVYKNKWETRACEIESHEGNKNVLRMTTHTAKSRHCVLVKTVLWTPGKVVTDGNQVKD